MGADHRAQVEDLMAGYRRSREQLAGVQRALAALTASATSPCGLVTATVSAQGALTGLVIDDAAYRAHRPQALAALVVRVAGEAAAEAARAAARVVEPVLPAGADPDALLRGAADLTAAEIAPPPRAEADYSFEDMTWMEPDGRGRH